MADGIRAVSRAVVASAVVALAVAAARARGLHIERELLVAAGRALLQLGAVALVVTAVFDQLGLSALFLLVMLAAASASAAGRWGNVARARARALAAIGAGAGTVLAVVFASGAFELQPRFLIPLAGIVIGGSMTATALAGRRLGEEVGDHVGTIEARLALGISARQALAPHISRAAVTALIPAIDQTKNVGLVTLPGAFVGMLLGGASPIEAAQVQLTVLFLLLGAESIAAIVATHLVANALVAPGERIQLETQPPV